VTEYRDAVWDAVPQDAVPERFAARLKFLLARVAPGERVLDLGCGDGSFAAELTRHGAIVTAADVAAEAVRRAGEAAGGADVVRIQEGEALPFDDDAFDVVWVGEVVEHVVDVGGWLEEIRRVLRDGGRLVLTTPYHGRVTTVLLGLSGRAFDDHFDPRADHLRFFTARSLTAALQRAGFTQVDIAPTGGVPLLRRALHACAS